MLQRQRLCIRVSVLNKQALLVREDRQVYLKLQKTISVCLDYSQLAHIKTE